MSRVGLDLLSVALLSTELQGPAAVHFGGQVVALGVVDAILLPASDKLTLELGGLLTGLDSTLTLEVAADEF